MWDATKRLHSVSTAPYGDRGGGGMGEEGDGEGWSMGGDGEGR